MIRKSIPVLFCLGLVFVILSGVWANPDDDFQSENKSKGVRAPGGVGDKPAKSAKKTAGRGKKTDAAETPAGPEDKNALNAADVKKLGDLQGKSVAVRGKVASVYVPASKKVCILNFGKDHKSCFKVAIFSTNFGKWDGGVESIKKMYSGKTVTVEGQIKLYEGLPEIIVSVPSQIRITR